MGYYYSDFNKKEELPEYWGNATRTWGSYGEKMPKKLESPDEIKKHLEQEEHDSNVWALKMAGGTMLAAMTLGEYAPAMASGVGEMVTAALAKPVTTTAGLAAWHGLDEAIKYGEGDYSSFVDRANMNLKPKFNTQEEEEEWIKNNVKLQGDYYTPYNPDIFDVGGLGMHMAGKAAAPAMFAGKIANNAMALGNTVNILKDKIMPPKKQESIY